MSSFAAGKPSQGSSPNSVSPYSTLVVQVVSTFQSAFDESLSHIDASSLTGRSLSLWPEMYHSPMINALCEAPSNIFKRFLDPNKDGPLQLKLFTRMPSQSRMSIMYNFSRDYILREHYRDPRNEVRIGKLLVDLDVLAGTIDMKVATRLSLYVPLVRHVVEMKLGINKKNERCIHFPI